MYFTEVYCKSARKYLLNLTTSSNRNQIKTKWTQLQMYLTDVSEQCILDAIVATRTKQSTNWICVNRKIELETESGCQNFKIHD